MGRLRVDFLADGVAALDGSKVAAVSTMTIFHYEYSFRVELGTRMQMMMHMVMALPICQTLQLLLIYFSVNFSQLLTKSCRRTI